MLLINVKLGSFDFTSYKKKSLFFVP